MPFLRVLVPVSDYNTSPFVRFPLFRKIHQGPDSICIRIHRHAGSLKEVPFLGGQVVSPAVLRRRFHSRTYGSETQAGLMVIDSRVGFGGSLVTSILGGSGLVLSELTSTETAITTIPTSLLIPFTSSPGPPSR